MALPKSGRKLDAPDKAPGLTPESAPESAPETASEPVPDSVQQPSTFVDRVKGACDVFCSSSTRGVTALWGGFKSLPGYVRAGGGSAVLLLLAAILFLAQPNWDWFKPALASIISGHVHRAVRIDGHLRVHFFRWTPDAALGGLHIAQPVKGVSGAPTQNLADIDEISVTAELMPLFIGRIVLPRLQIDRPKLALFQDQDGHANWDFSNGTDKGKPLNLPAISTFIITDGRITMKSVQRKLAFTGSINAHERADAGGQAFAMQGNGSLNGRIFQMNATGGPLINGHSNVPYLFDMAVRAGETHISAKGRVIHPFNLGQVDGAVSISGRNLYDLYYLTGLTLPNTPAYTISARVERNERVYLIQSINGRIGGSDIEGKLKLDTRNGRPDLTGGLSSRVLDLKDLGSLFGATAANAPKAPTLSMAPQATRGARRLLPDATLDIERIRGMDADVQYRALSVRAIKNMPMREVSLGIRLDHGLLNLDPIDFAFPQGHLIGTASIDARKAEQTNSIDMRLTGLSLQNYVPKFGGAPPLEGTLNARVRATGGGNSVHKAAASANGRVTVVIPGGMIRQSFAELMGIDATKGLFQLLTRDPHQTEVRCAIADFQVANGMMQARTIVFDTGLVLVNGAGSINLNDESLKLTFKGKPKKFRLVRINAPIVIGGHLTAPTFGIDPKTAILQGGLAAALNSILPFVNLDTAQNANCDALMSEARSGGASTKRIVKR